RIRIGHGVVLMPPKFNHPFRTAERIAALDIISNGRVDFGAGRSITEAELGGFGIDPDESRPMMQEMLPLFAKIWRNREFEGYEGRFVSLPPRVVVPKPVQKPHPPMWMACTSATSFQMAGEMGLGALCFTSGSQEELKANLDVYNQSIANAKPVGDFINKQTAGFTVLRCAPDNETAMARGGLQGVHHWGRVTGYFGGIANSAGYAHHAKSFQDRRDLAAGGFDPRQRAEEMIGQGRMCIGDPDTCAKVVEDYQALGIDQFMGIVQYGDITNAESLESIRLMGEEVIPRFKK
ncbi:MAG: flavin-dependent oxidoreductase, F420-dependent methylene-tetrahydromethanopterin reductase, partial [Caulobacteraceae bacterium]|nr:flavin-dependent oxidoreductase, F420-dependent methylene-tetrahydromethanopterin reductase [Caulobacteraceae bacterium]